MRSATNRFDPFGPWLVRAVLAGAVSACLTSAEAAPPAAQPANATWDFNIPAGDLEVSLDRFATQTGLQLGYRPDVVVGKRSVALRGRMTWRDALSRMLQGSGLEFRQVTDTAIVIDRPAPKPAPGASAATPAMQSGTQRDEAKVTDIGAVTVTGTRIRGGVTPSPVITIGQERIREEGFSNLGEVIRSVPQNFAGGQNPGVTGAGLGGMANQNITGGSALNLRGLGPDATLTLLNGRRLTYGGFVQAVDVSTIPVEAVDRFEIVPDGASAIYGSDAVGGVANIILKRDFDGFSAGARYGTASDGGLSLHEYTATAGTTWDSGGLIATWKKSSSDSIMADERSYTRLMTHPTTLYPEIDSSSVLLSAHQSLGAVAELRMDATKSRRDQARYFGYPSGYYYFGDRASVWLLSPSLEFYLPQDWSLTIGGTHGKDQTKSKAYYVDSSGARAPSHTCYCNDSRSYEVSAEGPLFPLNGSDARLAAGIGSRSDRFVSEFETTRMAGDETSRYAYLELSMPLVSPASARTGVRRFEINAAVRGENYDSFGRVVTPKVGVIYDPNADLTFKVSWGHSYKAPMLFQRYETKAAYLWAANMVGGTGYSSDATVLMSYGGNADLKAEKARTWAASMAFHPEGLPGLDMELTWFGIDYTDRVVQPLNHVQALSNPIYALSPYVDLSPTPDKQAALLATYHEEFINYAGVNYDPGKVVAILHNQYVNASRQRIHGLDFSGSYRFPVGGGFLTIRGAASQLNSTQQTSAEQPRYDLAGSIFNPAKYKTRTGAVWTKEGFSASGFVNYTSGVTSKLIAGRSEKTASYTTFDATLRYAIERTGDAWSGWEFMLSAENLFNRNPPLYTVTFQTNPPFDSTNYSAIGRYLTLSIAKHW